MNVLIEAVGSPVWGPLLPLLRQCTDRITGLDVDAMAWGLYKIDKGYLVPGYGQRKAWPVIRSICTEGQINVVYPSVNEGLRQWAVQRKGFRGKGIDVVVSDRSTIRLCDDKWETYRFFMKNGIPTPLTSLKQEYPLLKPRVGRGGTGIRKIKPDRSGRLPKGYITQQFLEGQEYSVDCLCNPDGSPVCIVVRERIQVESGVSVKGRVVCDPEIESWVRRILAGARFFGPVDIQCFRTRRGVLFTEINPRIAGGMSLSMAATGNWFKWINQMLAGKTIKPVAVRHGLVMMRNYSDVIVHEDQLIKQQ